MVSGECEGILGRVAAKARMMMITRVPACVGVCGRLGMVRGAGGTGVRRIQCNIWEERVHVPMLRMLNTSTNMFIVCVTFAQSGDMYGRCAAQYT